MYSLCLVPKLARECSGTVEMIRQEPIVGPGELMQHGNIYSMASARLRGSDEHTNAAVGSLVSTSSIGW